MFSPRAENLAMPGRPLAEPRSRSPKLPLLAIWADQSDATRARSPSHLRGARPLACRSALRRANRSLVSFWAVEPPPAGAATVLGGAAGRGRLLVVVAARVVAVEAVVLVVVARPGRRAAVAPFSPCASAPRTVSGAGAAEAVRS